MMLTDTKRVYPRTGKRGVPQQFPRKLFEMLEAESITPRTSNSAIVNWSSSGRAFRIADVSLFSEEILPKYFKTKKFSSFQRNLNLYGFTKVRKGPEIDMYYHPSFTRGDEGGLSKLRKRTKARATKSAPLNLLTPRPSSSPNFQHSIRVVSPIISSYYDDSLLTTDAPHLQCKQNRENSERLSILADAMVMMIEGG
ncbi:hypothetical protein ACHAWF_005636 [Thalassiosira exigua]